MRSAVIRRVVATGFRRGLAYRGNAYLQFIATVLNLVIMTSIWGALYAARGAVEGVTYDDMIVFAVVNAVLMPLTGTGVAWTVSSRFVDGSIADDLLRPVSYKWYLFFDELGETIFDVGLTVLLPAAATLLIIRPQIDIGFAQLLLFFPSAALGVLIAFTLEYILGLTSFWLRTAFYLSWVSGALREILSGRFVPLWFYPPALAAVAMALPFRLVAFAPVAILIGRTTKTDILWTFLAQLGWLAALLVVERIVWRRAVHVITIEGG